MGSQQKVVITLGNASQLIVKDESTKLTPANTAPPRDPPSTETSKKQPIAATLK
jgi:hypothetical protein